jgi:GYF domain 2
VNWYYAIGDKTYGPVQRAELESLFGAGTITSSTLVIQEGMYDWVPYVDLKKTTQFLSPLGTAKTVKPPQG